MERRSLPRSTSKGSRPRCWRACRARFRRFPSNLPRSNATLPWPACNVARRSGSSATMRRSAKARSSRTRTGSGPRRSDIGSMACRSRPIPETFMRRLDVRLPLLLALMLRTFSAHAADDVAVDVVNASEPTLCAEKDNVYLKLASADVRRFTVEAVHPAYMGTIVVDRYAPDFRNCDMSGDPAHKSEPRRVTIYETNEWQLVGHTFPSYWRPNNVPVRVGERVESGLHLLQLWTRFQERAEEVLVLYPADGYWRARPLPPAHLRWSAYGSSFLVGPIEMAGRPLVDISDIAFDPATRTFRLNFKRGGAATLRLETLDQERIVLDVNVEAPISDRP